MSAGLSIAAVTQAYQTKPEIPQTMKHMDLISMQKTAEDFEAFYLGQMLQPMFANIEAAEPFNGGSGSKIWKQLQVDEFGKAIAKNGGVGIADMVLRQMIEMQEGDQGQ